MSPARPSHPANRLLVCSAVAVLALVAGACGTQQVSVSKSQGPLHEGAVLFNQRCSGCHTLSYAATQGSAVNVRTAQYNNGPNFNIRCERPIARVLYAIENGGFSGAIMPQNVVVGQQAIEVAKFVSTYAGRQAPRVPGAPVCSREPVGTIPSTSAGAAAATSQLKQSAAAQKNASGPVRNTKHNRGARPSQQKQSLGQGHGTS